METRHDGFVLLDENTVPALVLHPGEILREELKARGIMQKDFAAKIGMQATHLSALINGMRNITPAIAEKIAMGLDGIPSSFWTGLQERYNKHIMLKKQQGLSRLVAGYSHSMEREPHPEPAAVLASPKVEYGTRVEYVLSVPPGDSGLLEALAIRMGWHFETK